MTTNNTLALLYSFHSDLKVAKEMVYDTCGFDLTNLRVNSESVEYGACSFELDGKKIQHRVSKITPTKTGQFVTIWKRNNKGLTEPFDIADDIDFLIITARNGDNLGQFIFPKSVLADKGIISHDGKDGKRGIRVYPPWDRVANKQAEKTQRWQTKYFLTIKDGLNTPIINRENLRIKITSGMDANKITRVLTLNAPVEKVWHVLTTPKETKKFMFNCEVSSDWKVGSDITWSGNYQGYESGERGVILEIEEHKHLKYTSIDPNFGIEVKPENYLHISYDLTEKDGKTELTTTIENFNSDPKRIVHIASGWDTIVLSALEKIFSE